MFVYLNPYTFLTHVALSLSAKIKEKLVHLFGDFVHTYTNILLSFIRLINSQCAQFIQRSRP